MRRFALEILMALEARERDDALVEQRKLALVAADKQLVPLLYPEWVIDDVQEVAPDQVPEGATVDYRLVAPEGFSADEYERLMAELDNQMVTVQGDDGGEWQ